MQESGKHMQTTMTGRDREPARRRVLQGMAALGGGMLLAACGHDSDDDGWRRERIIRTDQQAGTETRLVVGQALELRLAVDESLLIYRRGRSSPEMRRVSGPERRTIDGRVYQVWVFAAVIGGACHHPHGVRPERAGGAGARRRVSGGRALQLSACRGRGPRRLHADPAANVGCCGHATGGPPSIENRGDSRSLPVF